MKLSKTKTIRISETQHKTLQKMKSYNIDVGRFIREAIKEKIEREYKGFIPKQNQDSFQIRLNKAIKPIKYNSK